MYQLTIAQKISNLKEQREILTKRLSNIQEQIKGIDRKLQRLEKQPAPATTTYKPVPGLEEVDKLFGITSEFKD